MCEVFFLDVLQNKLYWKLNTPLYKFYNSTYYFYLKTQTNICKFYYLKRNCFD